MRWFLNLSTRAKLHAAFAVMIALLIVVAAAGYRSVILIHESQKALYEQELTDMLDIKQIRANQVANRADILYMMLPESGADVGALERVIADRIELNDKYMRRLFMRNDNDAESMGMLRQLESLRATITRVHETQILPLIRAGALEEARRLHVGIQADSDAQMDKTANAFVSRTEDAARAALARSEERTGALARVILVTAVVALLLAAAMTVLLNRALSDPLRQLSAAAERVAGGDLTVEVPADGRADETGTLLQTFARMLASLRETTRDLSTEKQLLQNLMDSVPDAIFFKDREHRFLRVNRVHATKVLGLARPEDAVGRPTTDFFPLPEARQRDAEDEEILRTGATLPDKVRRISLPNGKARWSSTTKAPIKDESGQVSGLVGIARDITERHRMQEALAERESALQHAQQMAKLAHVVTRPDGSFESWSETLPQLVGLEIERMPKSTRDWLNLVHPDDKESFRARAIEAGATVGRLALEYRLRRADDAWIYVRQVSEPVPGDSGVQTRWFGTLQDVTEQKAAERRVERLNRVYAVLSGINTLIVRERNREQLFREACRIAVEAGKFRFVWIGVVDPVAMQLAPVAWAGEERDFLATVRDRLSLKDGDSRERSGVAQAALSGEAVISNDVANDPRIRFKEEHADRGIRSLAALPLWVAGKVLGVLALHASEAGFFDDDEVRLLSELAGDIAFALEHLEKAEKLEYLASYDPLTGLANRSLLHERLGQFLQSARRERHKLALLILDIERFRAVNDAYGRHAGDELLKQVASRMAASRNDPTRVARIGADQFALVLPRVRSEEEMGRRLEGRLEQFFGTPYTVAGTELRISAKIGIALFPTDGADADTLFKHAEAAMERAKRTGERFLFFTQEMTERVADKLALENKLRQALEKEEFVLYYQPKVSVGMRKIVGVEALIRWQTQDRGLVPPAHFIPLLEETGLILQVGSWALARAARDHRSWVEQKLQAPRVAVNVSQVQMRQRDFLGVVERAIIDGVAPTAIDLEITESLVMEDVKSNIEKLKAVRGLGVRIAIDDFGTGYSSLGYLAQLPVESLKIDRSFIMRMEEDPNAMTLVSTIISLAHSLRLKVVAEGVETEGQAKLLSLLRCDEMQGYLFSKPVPPEQLVTLLRGTSGESGA
ncbi:MAG TPA: EAL domain-containing protein [Methyloceanibacter sp.]|nr:EAL domain-containing protein [Methyloceanibacter sp.]